MPPAADSSRFDKALAFVLDHEGRTSAEPSGDPDTNWGITQRVYDAFRSDRGLPTRPVDSATQDEIRTIYWERFWLGGRCDRLPEPVDLIHFDSRVNLGEGTANRMLQTAVGSILVDGMIGSKTLAAVREQDPIVLGARYCSMRLMRYVTLARSDDRLRQFLRGWARRVAHLLEQL
jgi:lysozyme family protein